MMGWNQKSYFLEEGQGCLYLVPTPIGNLQDMTFRAIETLKNVDYIAAEDTRQTRKLLNAFQIEKPLISYYEHNKESKGRILLGDVQQGKQIALVSDAGMPGVSDPGEDIVRLLTEAKLPVIALPGPNAALTGLIASGLSTKHFTFYGFLERNKKKREAELLELKLTPYTLIFYEAPHRLKETLQAIEDVLGPRKGAIVREISKKHEEYIRGSITELVEWSQTEEIRGEFCILIEGNHNVAEIKRARKEMEDGPWWEKLSLVEHVEVYIEKGHQEKEALKMVAKERGLPKRQVYQAFHIDYKTKGNA